MYDYASCIIVFLHKSLLSAVRKVYPVDAYQSSGYGIFPVDVYHLRYLVLLFVPIESMFLARDSTVPGMRV